MLPLSELRDNSTSFIDRLNRRGKDYEAQVFEVLDLDATVRRYQRQNEALQAEINELSRDIGRFMKAGDTERVEAIKSKVAELKSRMIGDVLLKSRQDMVEAALLQLPNAPHDSVPDGTSAEHNVEVRTGGVRFEGEAEPHWELAKRYGVIDFELGNKITGAGFPVYKGKGARLQRALINFFLDCAEAHGYVEHQVPLLVNQASVRGTGQFPDKEGQMYLTERDNLYLIPTAEVPLTNIYRDTIVDASALPIKFCGYTPCFRREAGTYGSDVRGLNRLHQFDKVEIVQIANPEDSYAALEGMVSYVESLLTALGLEYRVLKLCAGDMGFTSALTYDLEVYSPGQKKWLEVSSVSNFETYQSNRLKLRFKDEDKKNKLAHTLNGSALALPRIMAALLETYCSENWTTPFALANYL